MKHRIVPRWRVRRCGGKANDENTHDEREMLVEVLRALRWEVVGLREGLRVGEVSANDPHCGHDTHVI